MKLINIFKKTAKSKESKKPFQLNRETDKKYTAIKENIDLDVSSVLDVGCNAGEITRRMGEAGYFAVGIDKKVDVRGIENPLNGACLGNIDVDMSLISKLPLFDVILLLSVHHQMIKSNGDEWTKNFIRSLGSKCSKIFFIEFAGINSKYGKEDGELFIDNDEESVVTYGNEWLKKALPDFNCFFVDKITQTKKEPYRFLFKCVKR
jgi:SAM-dependent methyltransferase